MSVPGGLAAELRGLGAGLRTFVAGVEALATQPWRGRACREDAAFLGQSSRRLLDLHEQLVRQVDADEDETDLPRRLRHELRGQLGATLGCAQLLVELAVEESEGAPASSEILSDLEAESDRLVAKIAALGREPR